MVLINNKPDGYFSSLIEFEYDLKHPKLNTPNLILTMHDVNHDNANYASRSLTRSVNDN